MILFFDGPVRADEMAMLSSERSLIESRLYPHCKVQYIDFHANLVSGYGRKLQYTDIHPNLVY